MPSFLHRKRGFTLIELLVAVTIVGILTAVAVPSYQSYMVKSRRSSAQTHLVEIAQRQQQYLLDARAYAPNLNTLGMTTSADVSAYYTIAVTATGGPPPAFTVTATPRAGTAQAGDVTLTIDQAGVKTPSSVW